MQVSKRRLLNRQHMERKLWMVKLTFDETKLRRDRMLTDIYIFEVWFVILNCCRLSNAKV